MITLKEWQIEPYNNLCNQMAISDKCAYISATGTGKTYVVGKYIEDNHLENKTIVLTPSNAIKENWKKLFPKIITNNYHSMRKVVFSDYDLIVLDEFHHLGAEKWNPEYLKQVQRYAGKIIGLTATPIRFLDEGRDMSDELFKDCIVDGYDLPKAINKGILPTFTYICALYSVPEYLKKKLKRNDLTETLFNKLDLYQNENSVEKILTKHIKNNRNYKCAVFVDAIESFEEIEQMIRRIFPDDNHYIVHFKQKGNNEIISAFENDKGNAFIYSVDMLNEGVHIANVNTVIMLRRTRSPAVYLQQLGRALTSNQADARIQIIDLVANHRSIKRATGASNTALDFIMNGISNPQRQGIVCDYIKPELDLMEEIIFLNSHNWKTWEDEIIKQYYLQKDGTNKCLELLPERTLEAIWSRAKYLGIRVFRKTEWLEEEDTIIRKYYSQKNGIDKCCELLPNRKRQAILARASKLRIKSDIFWSEEEISIIRKYYPQKNGLDKCCELLPNKSRQNIYCKASELKVTSKNNWTEEEINIVKKYYPQEDGLDKCCELLQNRSRESIRTCAKKLGLKAISSNWTNEEDDIIRKYYSQKDGTKKCAMFLQNRSETAIRLRAQKIGINSNNDDSWAKEEINIIQEYYPQDDGVNKCIELMPNRSKESIYRKASLLGIKAKSIKWSEEEDEIIKRYYSQKGGIDKCCELIPTRKRESIYTRASEIGVKACDVSWSKEEDEILKKYYVQDGGIKKSMKYLPNRSRASVKTRARKLGVTKNQKN